ncbi:sigma-70 family RNA polymerase sigma factor [Bordetella sp. N]|uniref:sigma-70 family RNA polymerase sigma factor n=1 Tax=Bordetella sp. N TaxID=1746199 RepID=UPI000708E5A7|nr:sigma-70 family RNA polymerase sigma factor [Bordetella sp. N]ALM87246.1 RNA polymerase subunit sigma [Bordetella sp. N]
MQEAGPGALSATEHRVQHALQTLYREHHGWLQGWLQRRLDNNAFDAADLAQDTFVRVLTKPEPVSMRQPRAFLTAIAKGLLVDLWRRRELERAWLEALALLPEPETPSPEERLCLFQTLAAIDYALARLPQRARQVFMWARLEGMSCPAIVERLGVSLATVERDLAAALRLCYAARFEA